MSKVLGFIGIGLCAGALLYSVNDALSLPDVHVSYSTNHCVKVVNYTDSVYSCENMPVKYNHVWAK